MIRFLTMIIPVCIFSFAGMGTSNCDAEEPQIDYSKKIAPLFNKYCAGCHNNEDAEGKFSLENYSALMKGGKHGPALLAGESKTSRLLRMMTGKAKPQMPPEDNEMPSEKEIALIAAWIDGGAKGPTGKNPKANQLMVPNITPSKTESKPITSLTWSASTNNLAIASYREVMLSKGDNQPLRKINDLPGKVNSVQFNLDGTLLVTASGVTGLYGEAAIWNVANGEKLKSFRGHKDVLYAAQLSPDGKWLATGSYDKNIYLWNAESGKKIRELKGHNGAIFDLAFSPDSKILISASADATVKVWQVATGKRLDTRSEPLREQFAVAFSPDGKYFFAAGGDKRIRKWKLISQATTKINPLVTSRFAHEGPIVDLVFSPDTKILASISEDRSLKMWNAKTVTQLSVEEEMPAIPVSISFSANSQKYIVGYANGSTKQSTNVPRLVASTTHQHAKPTTTQRVPRVSEQIQMNEQEPNNSIQTAMSIPSDVVVSGKIQAIGKTKTFDADLYRFQSHKNEEWTIEINAARNKSTLDSKIEILDAKGNRIKRVLLRAVRDSYFTFRGKGSDISNDYRLQNWREIGLNEYLYANGEVVKMMIYPRGPDSGFNVYPGTGKRYTYFGTSAITHAMHEPCYIVEPYPVGTKLPPNGLPTFDIYYENDDDPRRELGKDSRLNFTAPEMGTYFIRVTDIRSNEKFQGENYHYKLSLHPRRPHFKVTLKGANPSVNADSGKEFELKAQRIDGYHGPIQIDITGVPPGFHVTTPLVIQAGQELAYGVLTADADAPAPTKENSKQTVVSATAVINGKKVIQKVNHFGEIKLLKAPQILVRVHKTNEKLTETPAINLKPVELVIHPGETITAKVHIIRKGYQERVQFGSEFSGRNLPHGVYIDNIGLSGLTLLKNQNERTFFITAAKFVPETTRTFHITAAQGGKQTSPPIILHVRKRKTKGN